MDEATMFENERISKGRVRQKLLEAQAAESRELAKAVIRFLNWGDGHPTTKDCEKLFALALKVQSQKRGKLCKP